MASSSNVPMAAIGGAGNDTIFGGSALSVLHDETVALDGDFLYNWIGHWQSRSITLARDPMQRAWLAAMTPNTTWCERCQLLCSHDEDCDDVDHLRDRWQACQDDDFGDNLGPAPEESLRMDVSTCTACPDDMVSDIDGLCVACAPGEAADGNDCVPCEPESSTPDELDFSTGCGFYEHSAIVQGGGQGCSKRTVMELVDLQASTTPQEVIVSASYVLPEPTGLSTPAQKAKAWSLACAASSARLVIYTDDDPSDDEMDLLGDQRETGVLGCDETTAGVCTKPTCSIKAKLKVPQDMNAPDDRRFRLIAEALAAKIHIPTDATSELDNPFPVGCSGADDETGDCCGNNKPCKQFVEQNKNTEVPIYKAAQRMVQTSHDVIVRVHAGTCTDPNIPTD